MKPINLEKETKMFEQIKTKLQEEDTQRAILQGVGTVAIFIATTVFSAKLKYGLDGGIDKLMEHLHPTNETPA